MTPEIQALVTEAEAHAKIADYERRDGDAQLLRDLAAALVQQAQRLKEQEEDLTRVDEQTVIQPERATAAENEATRCEGRYPVPQISPPRDEPFEVTYRCGRPDGHVGPHGPDDGGSEASDAVARAEGTSTSGPRALDPNLHAVCNQTIENYERNIADLVAQLARVTAERKNLAEHVVSLSAELKRMTDKRTALPVLPKTNGMHGVD